VLDIVVEEKQGGGIKFDGEFGKEGIEKQEDNYSSNKSGEGGKLGTGFRVLCHKKIVAHSND
jgi:hypothetical protein